MEVSVTRCTLYTIGFPEPGEQEKEKKSLIKRGMDMR